MNTQTQRIAHLPYPTLPEKYIVSRHERGVDCNECPVWELRIDAPTLQDVQYMYRQQKLLNRVAEAFGADWICLTMQGQLYWRWPRAWEEKLHRWQASQQEQIRLEQQLGERLEQFRARWRKL